MEAESCITPKFKLSCVWCFAGSVEVHEEVVEYRQLERAISKTQRISPCAWLKKCEPTSRKSRKHHRHSRNSSDFSYDASSYALNFDEECRFDDHEFPSRGICYSWRRGDGYVSYSYKDRDREPSSTHYTGDSRSDVMFLNPPKFSFSFLVRYFSSLM
ncbi:uncharacterized protein G2W53_012659 [Senna tora]|uniref:Uncharacterized protein n=1 Tax=Senna tora TaxID=362788 RepID=A0A834U0X7_9FABA|nr:uncharacterized protein G2W53_012659 [Senna tora]